MVDSMNKPEIETLDYHSPLCKCPDCEKKAEPKQPNKLTAETLEKSERGEDLHEFSNVKDMMKELNKPEQPNQQLMLIQTIQGLMACVNDNFDELCVLGSDTSERKTLIAKALEEIDLFEKTTLFDLQKEYE